MDKRHIVYDKLKEMDIPYELEEHPAAFTIEEMDALDLTDKESVVKNLFLRDAGGKRHFLVTLQKDKKADLKKLRELLGSTALSFASEERLNRFLGLSKGEVTPFGILNDRDASVEVVFDRDLLGKKVGVHPNDNTATVYLAMDDLVRVIRQNGNSVKYVEIEP